MRKMTIATILLVTILIGCKSIDLISIDDYLDSNGYVLLKKDAHLLDGPYRIIERVSSEKIIAEKDNARYTIFLRGCKGFGGFYENVVKGSYLEDRGLYLLKESSVNLPQNEIKAIVYRPANRVYVGMPNGFDNLTYTMPQLLHIAYGELHVDHSDTNYPLYKVFCDAEYLAKKYKKGYWETHRGD